MPNYKNTSPWYDDFDPAKNFHQILFKPDVAVQARELTQSQSILRDQIAKFGNHIFQHGSVVIPGNSFSDNTICFVKVSQSLTAAEAATLEGLTVTGSLSGLVGYIRKALIVDGSDPATLYVSYKNSGTNGSQVFSDGETLTTSNGKTLTCITTGASTMAFINAGVFYVNGSFVQVSAQSIVVGKYTNAPSAHVLLKIVEEVVTSDTDVTLLEPAQGTYNYAAPGADRLKISLILDTKPLGTSFGDNYIEIMRFNEGVIEEHSRYPKYSELEKSLARRTSDESGDYVVNGLNVSVREHLKSTVNNGRYDSPVGDESKLVYTVNPGKAYIQGFEIEKIADVEVSVSKARSTLNGSFAANPLYGQYLYVMGVTGMPDLKGRETVNLYKFFPTVLSEENDPNNIIGTCKVVAIDYYDSNATPADSIYRLYIQDLPPSIDATQIGGIKWSNVPAGGKAKVLQRFIVSPNTQTDFTHEEILSAASRSGKVAKFTRSSGELFAYKHSTASMIQIADTITGGTSTATAKISSVEVVGRLQSDNLLIPLPKSAIASVKTSTNSVDASYSIYYQTTFTTNASGAGGFTVTGMTPVGPASMDLFTVTSSTGAVVNITSGNTSVTGNSVSFTGLSNNTTYNVVCMCVKSGSDATPKTKTIRYNIETNITPASLITLAKADVLRINSIVSTVDGDVTDRYKLDNGQRDYAYLLSSLILVGVLPSGKLDINYDYFQHNAAAGDYFCVDSYSGSGLTDYYTNPGLVYTSPTTGKNIDLRNCLDFRPLVGDDNSFSGLGAITNYVPQHGARLSSSYQYYVGRIDGVYLTKGGLVTVKTGTPSDVPVKPQDELNAIQLATVSVPPYTYKSTDCAVTKTSTRVYTMKDVARIDSRITDLENYISLTALESTTVNYNIIDTRTGLNRYKSGFLIDSFNNADSIADITNPKFKVAYDSGTIVPEFETFETELELDTSSVQVTGNYITLPYTTTPLAKQPLSSNTTNINPFSVFNWDGRLNITPSTDSWIETVDLPTVFNSTTETITIQATNWWWW